MDKPSLIAPEVLERIQLWKPYDRETWPEWYVWSGGWYENDCEHTVYTVWDVGPESVVFDVGGYEGAWSRKMAEKYDPIVYLFEPTPRAFKLAQKHLGDNPKAHLHQYAVGAQDTQVTFYDCDRDGAGVYAKGDPVLTLPMRSFAGVLEELGIEQIDLMSLNIEGGEYDLLDHMIRMGTMGIVRQMMIQWHWRGDGDAERQYVLQSHVAKTHRMVWNYGAWEAWERKQDDRLAQSVGDLCDVQAD